LKLLNKKEKTGKKNSIFVQGREYYILMIG